MTILDPSVIILGLVIGSFLNVCIYRIPREKSIVTPPSACPCCSLAIKPWDNIPVISYLWLRGRCRNCSEKISPRYPIIEALNGFLYWAVFRQFDMGWHLPALFAFVSAMLVITLIDFDFQIIPDAITLPGMIVGAAASFILPDPFANHTTVGFTNSIIGLVSGYGSFLLIAVIGSWMAKAEAMGGGDLKLMGMVGAFMGWKAVLLTTLAGSIAGSIIGIGLMAFKGKDRKTAIPFGPFLAIGALISLFFGEAIASWYLSF
ncbi:MAG: prepilin peptidase [Nitrospirae bacterium]|nr:MAG: prepilin peptidase [Nitrospirota bacterium]